MLIKIPRGWELPERLCISESRYMSRRQIVKALGFTGAGLAAARLLTGCFVDEERISDPTFKEPFEPNVPPSIDSLYPADPNPEFADVPDGRTMTPEDIAGGYNNYYEFGINKTQVQFNAQGFPTKPWQVRVTGLCDNPFTFDWDDIHKMFALEERVYKLRCVEAWSMVVPWTGFPLAKLIEKAQPRSNARFVRMETFHDPDNAVGQRNLDYPFPYYEGLRIDEAVNELSFLVTGIFGHVLPNQHGAPLRLATPWKYGFKSIKGIVEIRFVDSMPATFWPDVVPDRYDFLSNVDPTDTQVPWDQSTERDIGLPDGSEEIPTKLYNGYGNYVADLYTSDGESFRNDEPDIK
ncbi:protein-methionine-sulfoxide reductase catalytic subunit MsrP [bacterium]|nr:protein-methionine-sulfoxide reductase catalytic subunit MsrP [bacterium]